VGNIEWLQVLVAFALGVMLSAIVKGIVGQLRGHASSALG
jgi:hypothetical protein